MTNREDLARVLKDYQHLVNQYQKTKKEIDHLVNMVVILFLLIDMII